MKTRFSFAKIACAAIGLGLALAPAGARACAACYGEPGSPMSRGLTWAVIALAGSVSLVLVALTAFFVHIGRHRPSADEPPQNDNQI